MQYVEYAHTVRIFREICIIFILKNTIRLQEICGSRVYSSAVTMDEGALKTPVLNVVFTGNFCLGWCSNFVGPESGQKQSVKLLQNMVYNTTQHPHLLPPQPPTVCIYCAFLGRGGGGQREGRGAPVHKYSFLTNGPLIYGGIFAHFLLY
jgi:hypothetical protein